VVDGPTYSDAAAICVWAQCDNFGVHMHFDVLRELDASGTTLEVTASSKGGYNGPGTMTVTLREGRIERLVIRLFRQEASYPAPARALRLRLLLPGLREGGGG
jgi:hypothetical protein